MGCLNFFKCRKCFDLVLVGFELLEANWRRVGDFGFGGGNGGGVLGFGGGRAGGVSAI